MPRSSRPRRRHVHRLPAIPMMATTHTEFARQLHVSLAALAIAPAVTHWEAVAMIFNVVTLAIRHKPSLRHEARLLNGGAMALQDIERKVQAIEGGNDTLRLQEHELAPIRIATTTVDQLLPRIGVTALYQAWQELLAMRALAA